VTATSAIDQPTQGLHRRRPPDDRKAPAPARTSRDGTAAPGRADHHTARGTASSTPPEAHMPARTAPRTPGPQPRPRRPWPRAFLDLGAVLTAPACARAWTREILWEWGAAELADTAELVASELVTNSVTHSAGPDGAVIRLVLTLDQGELAILVRDNNPGVPMARQPGEDEEEGRGLLIVEQLSERCGWYPLENAKPTKVTWAVISGPDHVAGERPAGQDPGGLPDAGRAVRVRPAPVLQVRHRQASPPATGMKAPKPVDPAILARVKEALERL
jgi:anti-sigma regulatory factor (Ser/Thr protein kinase)